MAIRIAVHGPLVASTVGLQVSAAVAGLSVVCIFEEYRAGVRTR